MAAATKSQRVIQREKHTQEGGQARFYSECSYAIAVVNCGVWGCGVMGYGSHPVAFDTCMVVQGVHRFCQVWGPGLWIMTSGSDAHRLYECGVRGFVKSGVWGCGVVGSGGGGQSPA